MEKIEQRNESVFREIGNIKTQTGRNKNIKEQ